VLEAAIELFSAQGLSVSVQEIARRAGVGTGTVSRHFPTKESLYEAMVHEFTGQLVQKARALRSEEPGKAFFDFFSVMVTAFSRNAGLKDALAGAGFDVQAAAANSEWDVVGAMRELLLRAQKAGAVRREINAADVKLLIVACCSSSRGSTDDKAPQRMAEVVRQGLLPS